MAEPTVGAGYARGLLDLAVARGADRAALHAQSGIAPADLVDQDDRVPFARYVALMRAAKTLTGDPALALHYGEAVDIAQVSIVGLICQTSETMLDALAQLNRFVRLIVEVDGVSDGERFQLTPRPDGLWAVDTRRDPNLFPELSESAFAQIVCGPRRHGMPAFVKAVHFTHPEPAYRAEYDRIFATPVVFGARCNALQIDPTRLSDRVQVLPSYAFGVLSEHAAAMLKDLESSKSVRGRVESLLMPILHTGEARIDAIASHLAMSRQTLFRKLKAEGVTFEQVLDGLRHRLALHYLDGRRVSVNETAYLVGFSDPAAFSRAFKRWTGHSPKAFRARTA